MLDVTLIHKVSSYDVKLHEDCTIYDVKVAGARAVDVQPDMLNVVLRGRRLTDSVELRSLVGASKKLKLMLTEKQPSRAHHADSQALVASPVQLATSQLEDLTHTVDKLERLAAEHSALQLAEQKEFRMTNELCERMLLTLDSLSVSGDEKVLKKAKILAIDQLCRRLDAFKALAQ